MNTSASVTQGMLCPVCKITLSISERQGVEIDYCPQCRGVWLDRGELDKIIERSLAEAGPAPQPPAAAPAQAARPGAPPHWQERAHHDDRDDYPRGRRRRRESFLSELFDFD